MSSLPPAPTTGAGDSAVRTPARGTNRTTTKGARVPTELHVATTGADDGDGSADRPLRTINRAAALAVAGDTVVVHGGEYREWVQPQRGGGEQLSR